MFARLLLLTAGLIGLAGWSGTYADEPPEPAPKQTPKKEAPKKEEPKKEDPKKEEPKKEDPKEEPKKDGPGGVRPGGPGGFPRPAKAAALKKYDEVITKEAKTSPGLFAVHKVDDKVYFEIPANKLNKLLLLRSEVAKGPPGITHNGKALGTKFVRLERRENKILVYEANYDKRGDKEVSAAVEGSGTESIIGTLQVEAEGKDKSAVVQVNGVFLQDSLEIGARRAMVGGAIDPERSFLGDVKAFPTNIEARATLTFRGGSSGGVGPAGPTQIPGAGGTGRTATILVHYSITALPDQPMRPRYFDPRVGYFTEGYTDFSNARTWVTDRSIIARYRLEKKDPKAEVSEPVQPIVFYLAAEIPAKYREAMRKGVEDWQPAFEKAGFKKAIICKDPPTKAEDPNWDPEDARYNVIRWVAEPVGNAMGPHVHDPRSGEILSAHIIFWHDILKISQMWYFVECSAQDPRARQLPLPDEITAELIRYVTAHEVGHTIGLRHNHRASQAYSIEQLRDPKFAAEYGPVASIMSYGRFNYVAQPEDNIAPKDLIPKLAPYDFFAIEWGYKPIPEAKSAEDEKPTLDRWAERQLSEPFLRFGGEDGPADVDPTVFRETLSNDPARATALGLKNLDRVYTWLVAATTKKGEEFDVLKETYEAVLRHRSFWYTAVVKMVGGVIESRTLGGSSGEQFNRVDKDKQQAAVKFLLESAFMTPSDLIKPSIVNHFKFAGVASDVMGQQRSILRDLLSASRLNRLMDGEIQDGERAFTVSELIAQVQAGLFSELKMDAPKIDPLRRNLQRAYIDLLKAEFNPPEPPASVGIPTQLPTRRLPGMEGGPSRSAELRATARIALRQLLVEISNAIPKTKDAATLAHLEDTKAEIESIVSDSKKK